MVAVLFIGWSSYLYKGATMSAAVVLYKITLCVLPKVKIITFPFFKLGAIHKGRPQNLTLSPVSAYFGILQAKINVRIPQTPLPSLVRTFFMDDPSQVQTYDSYSELYRWKKCIYQSLNLKQKFVELNFKQIKLHVMEKTSKIFTQLLKM